MPLTRTAEDPLLSEEEVLRNAALAQFTNTPTLEAARALVRAMVHFLGEKPQIAAQFAAALCRPPVSRFAEEPLLELLSSDDRNVREQAALILYRVKPRVQAKAKLFEALGDADAWVRAFAAKGLARIGGVDVADRLAEAIDEEATLESVSRMAEALALCGKPPHAAVLADQSEQLRERGEAAFALFVEALAAKLDPSSVNGFLEGRGEGVWRYSSPNGELWLSGGEADGGFAARARIAGAEEQRLGQDSSEALARLG